MNDFIKYALIVLAIIVALLLLSKLPNIKNKQSEHVPVATLHKIADGVRGNLTSATQDTHALLGLIHSTSALARLAVLQELDQSRHLPKKLDLDFEAVRTKLRDVQAEWNNTISNICPDLRLPHDVEWS